MYMDGCGGVGWWVEDIGGVRGDGLRKLLEGFRKNNTNRNLFWGVHSHLSHEFGLLSPLIFLPEIYKEIFLLPSTPVPTRKMSFLNFCTFRATNLNQKSETVDLFSLHKIFKELFANM